MNISSGFATTNSKKESIKLLLILFSHGYSWVGNQTEIEPKDVTLKEEGNTFIFLSNKKIVYRTKVSCTDSLVGYINIQKLLTEF